MTWQRMKKSSKAELIPTKNDPKPINKAKIAHPLNKLYKFCMVDLSLMFCVSISMYLGIVEVTGC